MSKIKFIRKPAIDLLNNTNIFDIIEQCYTVIIENDNLKINIHNYEYSDYEAINIWMNVMSELHANIYEGLPADLTADISIISDDKKFIMNGIFPEFYRIERSFPDDRKLQGLSIDLIFGYSEMSIIRESLKY